MSVEIYTNRQHIESFCAGSIFYELAAAWPATTKCVEQVAKTIILQAIHKGTTMLLLCDTANIGRSFIKTLNVARWFRAGTAINISYTYEGYDSDYNRVARRGRRNVIIEEVHKMGPWLNKNSHNQVEAYMIRINWKQGLPSGWDFKVV